MEYVNKLYSMCQRHVPPHKFICLTDSSEGDYTPGIELMQIPCDYPGWWSKLALFKPGLLPGRKLYLDLDLVIMDDLTGMVSLLDHHPGLWATDDFGFPISLAWLDYKQADARLKPEERIALGGLAGTINSSVMLWRDDIASDVWTELEPRGGPGMLTGDQSWITMILGRRIQLIPQGWVGSYRYGFTAGSIMNFHGDVKPHHVDGQWIKRHWR